jgi:hypothetical protein
MKKIVIRTLLFSGTTVLLLLVIFSRRSPFGRGNSSFAIEPGKEVTAIEFSESGKTLTLQKKGSVWLINGKSETRKNGVNSLLMVLGEMKIKSPVSSELFENEIVSKNIKPVRIKVFKGWKVLRSFLVYKTRSNTYGNIMKINEGSKPFIVYVPGYDGDITSEFTAEELYWKPYKVFNFLPSELSSVRFENLPDTAASFSITVRNNLYELTGNSNKLSGWDTNRVARYLSYFAWVPFESWAFETGKAEQSEIESRQPLYRLTVKTTGGKPIVLTLWERMKTVNNVKVPDSDRLFGKTPDTDKLFVMRYFDIDPLIKRRSYFFPH